MGHTQTQLSQHRSTVQTDLGLWLWPVECQRWDNPTLHLWQWHCDEHPWYSHLDQDCAEPQGQSVDLNKDNKTNALLLDITSHLQLCGFTTDLISHLCCRNRSLLLCYISFSLFISLVCSHTHKSLICPPVLSSRTLTCCSICGVQRAWRFNSVRRSVNDSRSKLP